MSTTENVIPIRPSVELGYIDRDLQHRIVLELQRDVDRLTLEARNRGRIEGMLAASVFVIAGLTAASFLVI